MQKDDLEFPSASSYSSLSDRGGGKKKVEFCRISIMNVFENDEILFRPIRVNI